uniref:Dynein regulatory complex subunit 7 n=1 Tax=Sphaeramia orbicularis TaxID=375764 RepID=A0A672ZZV6_9TELE
MCVLDQRTRPCPLLDAQVTPRISWQIEEEPEEQQEDGGGRSPDPLHGLRIHCWVLVLAGSRGVWENFFIDPLTGRSYSTGDSSFLAVESVWDNFNYYVNMQDCSNGVQDLVYDLDERSCWEPLLYDVTDRKQLMESSDLHNMGPLTQMKSVWDSNCASVGSVGSDLELGFPDGHKDTEYRKAKVDRFSPVLRRDRLVQRLTRFRDLDCECFIQRFNPQTNEHDMEFSSRARVDRLVRRVESPLEMTETYEARPDHLFYRRVRFAEPADERARQPAVKAVVERFHRNPSKPAHEDVAQRAFLLAQRRIEVTYHLEEDRFIPSKRKFIKPRESTERTKAGDFTQHMVSSFQVDRSKTPLSLLRLYQMLVSLMKDEDKVSAEIRESKKEVTCQTLMFTPSAGVYVCDDVSVSDDVIVCDACCCPWEAEDVEEQWRLQQVEDVLTRFLVGLQTQTQTQELHQRCLSEFTDRMKEQAQLIQNQHQKESQEMQDKEQWYQENQVNLNLQEVLDYHSYQEDKRKNIELIKTRLQLKRNETRRSMRNFKPTQVPHRHIEGRTH